MIKFWELPTNMCHIFKVLIYRHESYVKPLLSKGTFEHHYKFVHDDKDYIIVINAGNIFVYQDSITDWNELFCISFNDDNENTYKTTRFHSEMITIGDMSSYSLDLAKEPDCDADYNERMHYIWRHTINYHTGEFHYNDCHITEELLFQKSLMFDCLELSEVKVINNFMMQFSKLKETYPNLNICISSTEYFEWSFLDKIKEVL